MCWWCYWGWPKQIHDVYAKALDALGGNESALHWGPAHIVWEDENWQSVQWCLNHFDEWKADWNDGRYSDNELEIVRQSLVELLAVPSEFKQEQDEDADDYPADFPPPAHWEMVRP